VEVPIELENIFFDLDKADLRPESMVSLDKLVETLNDNPAIIIELGSHTDFRASDEYNNDLSKRRAQSVVNYLIEKGIARDRLVAKGYGETTPKKTMKPILFYRWEQLSQKAILQAWLMKTSRRWQIFLTAARNSRCYAKTT
jgi:hypothetical protein